MQKIKIEAGSLKLVNTPLDLKQRKNQSLDQLPGKHIKISKKKYTGNADKN